MQKAILVSALAATLYGCGITPKSAADACAPGDGYVVDGSGDTIVLTAAGERLRTGYWKADIHGPDCEAETAVPVTATTSDGDGDGDSDDTDSDTAAAAGSGEVERVRIDARVLFGFDSAVLTDAGKIELDLLISDMQQLDAIESVLVIGHTDSIGSTSYNQMLSERRAASVRDYIAANLSIDDITAEGRGEAEPIADNSTEAGRERNRRVEVLVDGTTEDAQQVAKEPVENKVSELIKKLTGG
ncbi:MAG: OmpA family protein [Pseudomonadota bacterium]